MMQQSKLLSQCLLLATTTLAIAGTSMARSPYNPDTNNMVHQGIVNELKWTTSDIDPDFMIGRIDHSPERLMPKKAASENEIQQGDLYYLLDDDTMEAMVSGWRTDRNNPNFDIVIPATVTDNGKTYKVTSFWERLFSRTGIETFVVGENIRALSDQLFRNCESLKSVILNEGLQAIGSEAFSGCINLTSIELPSTIESIGNYAFMGSGLSGYSSCIAQHYRSEPFSFPYNG